MAAPKRAAKVESGTKGKADHVFLIDGSGFIFRAFHALPPMTRADGTPVNAVFGFVNMLLKLIEDADAEYVAVIFDRARRTFRNDIYADYKAHRPDPPPELVPQFALTHEAVRAMNVAELGIEGFEADDLIATYVRLARAAGHDVTIVSSDKDMMQLVGPGVAMYDAMKNRAIGPEQVREKFGVGPDKVVDVQALAGDSSDNVPGVPGIGIKTAAQLIEEFGDLDTLLKRAGEIPQTKRREALLAHAKDARMSRELVRLRDDVPIEGGLEILKKRAPDWAKLLAFLAAQGFRSIAARVASRHNLDLGQLPAAITDKAKKETEDNEEIERKPAPPAGRNPSAGEGPAEARKPKSTAPDVSSYELIQDETALARWIAAARAAGRVAVDTETTSLDPFRADLVGVSLGLTVPPTGGPTKGSPRACYIPLGHVGRAAQGSFDLGGGDGAATKGVTPRGVHLHDAPKQIPLKRALAALAPLLADATVLKIGQNIKYDMQVLARHGIEIAPFDDTMLLSYVLEGGMHRHGMDELAALHLGHTTIKFSDVTGTGKSKITFDRVALDKALAYAAEDADVTYRLHEVLKPRLAAESLVTVYETLERSLVPVLAAMEREGIKVDAGALVSLSEDFARRLAQLEGDIHRLAGRAFNIGSPKQLGEILFDEMKLEGGQKAKTGAYTTDAEVLEELAAAGHELPARALEWRQLAKLKSTYSDALVAEINPDTGRVHTSYSQAVASTGRLSSSNPNLQNIPIRTDEGRKIRRAFIAEKGWKLVAADYSQIELRLLAHVASIDALKDAFHQGHDIHAMTASQVFGVPLEGMDGAVRRRAKAINFGIIYGISAFGLARQLGVPREEAARYIETYFERYPGIRDYMERTKAIARRQGFVTTLFGRKCHVRGINDKNQGIRGFAERAAINAPIQGGAADIIKRAMTRLPAALAKARLKARMLLQVHDELVFEVPAAEVAATGALAKKIMENAAHLDGVPLVVDVGQGANWDEAH
ncbi:MAG: DNA polymerase I [Rhodospirillales bacterium]|nr:DNA polymerase I [Rhodospirillales bacterium]MSP79657.1 DNA polymerase I [Rhodospirillales bacterium]